MDACYNGDSQGLETWISIDDMGTKWQSREQEISGPRPVELCGTSGK